MSQDTPLNPKKSEKCNHPHQIKDLNLDEQVPSQKT
jgi:hypothetical protein